jgi:hypothetical protein
MRRIVGFAVTLGLGVGYFACGSSGSPVAGDGGTATFNPGIPSFNPGVSGGSSTSGASTGPGFTVGSSGGSSVVTTGGFTGGTTSTGNPAACTYASGGPQTLPTAPLTGTVGATGGSVSRLVFAVTGDTRPPTQDDTGGYPTNVIQPIFDDIEALNPQPSFVIGTGDYQFSKATGTSGTGAAQVQVYMQARAKFSGAFFPAMGNHECGVSGSFTSSNNNNCGPGNPGGVTTNYNAFMNEMMQPLGQTNPYYSININASDGSWTAKIVVTAANAWTTAQETWLQTTMAQPTTYTFVVRHESSDATPPLPPGVAGVDAILATSKYTLLIVGHDHSHGHYTDASGTHQEALFGNGGAPITNGSDFGYGLFTQWCDGTIVVDAIDYMTGAIDPSFRFGVTPDGAQVQ